VSETSAGSIIGTLRLSITDFETGIAKAQALADELSGKNVDVQVKVETAGAETKLAALAASEDKVDEGNKKVGQSSKDAGQGMGLLTMAIVGVGPAIVPLAVASTGLAVGFGAMGAAGILAIVGIKQQMAAGTPVGAAYTAMVGILKGDLTTLGRTAAAGVLAPFQASVAALQTRMPVLNSIIGEFSVITGKTAGALTTGLVAAFISLEPLARDAGVYILNLSTRFAGMMSGPGVVTFGDYCRSVFPQVVATLESVVTAAIRLIAALAPLGLGTLGMLRTFTDLINALPVNVLAVLAQTASSVYLGFKSFSLLSTGITAVGTALQFVGVSAEGAAAGVRGLTMAAGAIGVIIAVATLLFSAHASAVQADQAATNSLTDALIRSNGAIDDNVRQLTVASLQADGSMAAYRALGGSLSDMTAAALGNAPAMARVNTTLDASKKAADEANSAATGDPVAWAKRVEQINLVKDSLGASNTTLTAATQAEKDHAAAMSTTTVATAAASTATLAQMTAAQQATSATQAQKTAILALNTALDAELSKELQLAGATSGFDQALLTMNTTLKTNKGTLNEHTQAGISDRQSIEQVVGSLQSQRDVQIKAGASTADATGKYQANSVALLVQAGRLYGTKSAAYAYMAQLLAIPKSVSTAVGLNVTPAMRALQTLLSTIPASRTITMYVAAGANSAQAIHYVGLNNKLAGMPQANGGILANAAGSITAFAGGGESHVAQIAPAGAMRLWAEPETGGEAYIPLAKSKRTRSLAILDETSKALGRSGSDMSGVRADLATVADEVRALGQVVHAELQAHARASQTMRRQNA
jgi:hypothetical protein